eukprot:TRINITY_DN3331_c0_g2_i2.p1 TRINITY_DN3331_c0_g2~~TRINITY_DN3331_c0_g2_i2.p1  ORF type:complete len:850 (-),score=264.85 TRINITY_DN3331_c0_g2_i2:61-2610(-)
MDATGSVISEGDRYSVCIQASCLKEPKQLWLRPGVEKSVVKIGRARHSDVNVTVPGISGFHVELRLLPREDKTDNEDGKPSLPRLAFRDLSTNGTGIKQEGKGSISKLARGTDTVVPEGALIFLPFRIKKEADLTAEGLCTVLTVDFGSRPKTRLDPAAELAAVAGTLGLPAPDDAAPPETETAPPETETAARAQAPEARISGGAQASKALAGEPAEDQELIPTVSSGRTSRRASAAVPSANAALAGAVSGGSSSSKAKPPAESAADAAAMQTAAAAVGLELAPEEDEAEAEARAQAKKEKEVEKDKKRREKERRKAEAEQVKKDKQEAARKKTEEEARRRAEEEEKQKQLRQDADKKSRDESSSGSSSSEEEPRKKEGEKEDTGQEKSDTKEAAPPASQHPRLQRLQNAEALQQQKSLQSSKPQVVDDDAEKAEALELARKFARDLKHKTAEPAKAEEAVGRGAAAPAAPGAAASATAGADGPAAVAASGATIQTMPARSAVGASNADESAPWRRGRRRKGAAAAVAEETSAKKAKTPEEAPAGLSSSPLWDLGLKELLEELPQQAAEKAAAEKAAAEKAAAAKAAAVRARGERKSGNGLDEASATKPAAGTNAASGGPPGQFADAGSSVAPLNAKDLEDLRKLVDATGALPQVPPATASLYPAALGGAAAGGATASALPPWKRRSQDITAPWRSADSLPPGDFASTTTGVYPDSVPGSHAPPPASSLPLNPLPGASAAPLPGQTSKAKGGLPFPLPAASMPGGPTSKSAAVASMLPPGQTAFPPVPPLLFAMPGQPPFGAPPLPPPPGPPPGGAPALPYPKIPPAAMPVPAGNGMSSGEAPWKRGRL